MSKYIINIPDDVQYVLLNGKADHKYYTAVHPIAELEELNSDYINEHYFGGLQDESYQRGLDDAWKLAEDVLYNRGNVLDILRCATVGAAFDKYSAGQALDILKAYKEKQKADDEIKVGDVVKPCEYIATTKAPFVVTKVNDEHVWGVDAEGSWNYWGIDEVTKTDKHFDIDKILEEMQS